jgi:hypothetical protein
LLFLIIHTACTSLCFPLCYIFIFCLFNDAVSTTDCKASSNRRVNEFEWICKETVVIPGESEKNYENLSQNRRDLKTSSPNTKQERSNNSAATVGVTYIALPLNDMYAECNRTEHMESVGMLAHEVKAVVYPRGNPVRGFLNFFSSYIHSLHPRYYVAFRNTSTSPCRYLSMTTSRTSNEQDVFRRNLYRQFRWQLI